jgi:sugar transferase (PEP-CTERM/EpsH1 system associated)
MRFLMITNTLPYPPIAGHPIRNFNLLKRIAQKNEVWLLALVDEDQLPVDLGPLQNICQDVILIPFRDFSAIARPLQALQFLLQGTPPELRLYESALMLAAIRDLVNRIGFDVIQIEDSYMARYQEAIPSDWRGKKVLTFIDIAYRQYDRIYRIETKKLRKLRLWFYSRMMRTWEPNYAAKFNLNITMSDIDRDLLLSQNPRLRIASIPNGVDTKEFQVLLPPPEGYKHLIYVGNMGYRPNVDAATYFCEEILPLIQQEIPDVEFWIVGNQPLPEVYDLQNEFVHVTGRVEDVRPYYQQSSVCVIPLRAGGGTRLKILESMALGRPVVSTSVGAEGIAVKDGENILIGDDPQTFADQAVRLLQDEAAWQKIASQARQFAVDYYDWDAITEKLLDTFSQLD